MSAVFTLILVLIGIIIICGVSIYLILKIKNKKIKELNEYNDSLNLENGRLKFQVEKTTREFNAMQAHVSRVNMTEKELKPIKEKIKEAQSEEDVMDSINLVLKRNASRVFNDKD